MRQTPTVATSPLRTSDNAPLLLLLILLLLQLCQRSCGAQEPAPQAGGYFESLSTQKQRQQQQEQQQQHEAPVISDELLLDLLHRAEEIARGPPERPVGGWQVLAKSPQCIVYRRQRRGMPDYEYAVRGRFADISAAAYFSALNSLPLRRSWDSTIKDIQLLQLKQATQPLPPPCGDPAAAAHSTSSCGSERRAAEAEQELCVYPTAEVRGASGGPQVYPVGGPEYEELIYWRVGLPWPAKDRDFVFARRLRGYKTTTSNSSSNRLHALVCGQLQAESAEAPPSDEAVRVEAFEAAIVAFPDNAEPGGPLSLNAGGASSVAHGDPSLHPYGGPGGPRGGDPEANGVIYVALHYDRSSSPVPSWLRSYIAAHTLPATMKTLRESALRLLSPSGEVRNPQELRGPGGAPLTSYDLQLLQQQFRIHSPQWKQTKKGPPEGEGPQGGEGPQEEEGTRGNAKSSQLLREAAVQRHIEQRQQQQQQADVLYEAAITASGPISPPPPAAAEGVEEVAIYGGLSGVDFSFGSPSARRSVWTRLPPLISDAETAAAARWGRPAAAAAATRGAAAEAAADAAAFLQQ